ncbi:hypothetical protein [Paraburkholderia dilworthii]|uniref:hypothetical protein n=1 Tax=Paraburkholderia dilworthii TaxID=948106 RepID=UPI0003F6EB8F|nr:hypothetical protein [Paraburkholderia dilworthii]
MTGVTKSAMRAQRSDLRGWESGEIYNTSQMHFYAGICVGSMYSRIDNTFFAIVPIAFGFQLPPRLDLIPR